MRNGRRLTHTDDVRAAIYTRVSTDEQARLGVSLDAQEARARAYCELHGLTIAAVFRDEGVSGAKPLAERPEGQKLSHEVSTGAIRHVVALKLDRLFRDAIDCLEVSRLWDHAGVSMHLIDLGGQTVNTASAMGRFMLTVVAGAAEMERNLIRERTRLAVVGEEVVHRSVARMQAGVAETLNRQPARGSCEHPQECAIDDQWATRRGRRRVVRDSSRRRGPRRTLLAPHDLEVGRPLPGRG